MLLCEVFQLVFDHLKDIATTRETLRVLRRQRSPAGPPEFHQRPKRTWRKGHSHVPVSRSRGLSEPCKVILTVVYGPTIISSISSAAIILRHWIPADPAPVLLLVPGGKGAVCLKHLWCGHQSRTKKKKKITDVKEDAKQVKMRMQKVGRDAEGKIKGTAGSWRRRHPS